MMVCKQVFSHRRNSDKGISLRDIMRYLKTSTLWLLVCMSVLLQLTCSGVLPHRPEVAVMKEGLLALDPVVYQQYRLAVGVSTCGTDWLWEFLPAVWTGSGSFYQLYRLAVGVFPQAFISICSTDCLCMLLCS
nr:PREDICTED: uncharacterized protein LOC102350069 isoform X1 [Latimeria chalumnae]|eukprot:XP_014341029.1 PREDICTED: uncharacterized protein LOC102350069 isoform X1 [Latimeria chalumnae]